MWEISSKNMHIDFIKTDLEWGGRWPLGDSNLPEKIRSDFLFLLLLFF